MYEILKAFAQANGWVFDYGLMTYHNLQSWQDDSDTGVVDTYLLLDPITEDNQYNEVGDVEAVNCSGTFFILKSSSLDEISYNERYDKYIKGAKLDLKQLTDHMICNNDVTITAIRSIEVINLLDYNFDGIMVDYQTTIRL